MKHDQKEPSKVYQELADSLPAGTYRAVLRVLADHLGESRAIKNRDIVQAVLQHGIHLHERQLRLAIHQLRQEDGVLIGSSQHGFFMIESLAEYRTFKARELLGEIIDLEKTVCSMDKAAEKMWGDSYQPSLLEGAQP